MAERRYREVTISSVLFGLFVGSMLCASITYAGLKIGFTIGGSAIAAVLGFGVLRGLMGGIFRGHGSILETNISQTVASAVNIPNSGVIFTIPVLFLLGYELSVSQANFWLLTGACVAGAILGGAFIIPLRKQMIDIDRLRFPTGTAVAVILKSPGAGSKKSLMLVAGTLLAAAIYLPAALPALKFRVSGDEQELYALAVDGKISMADVERTLMVADWIEKKSIPEDVAAKGKELATQTKKGTLEEEEKIALTAYRISEEKEDWSALYEFYAKKPLPGYGDINWRLFVSPPDSIDDTDAVTAYKEKMSTADRNGDGRPDLVLTDDAVDVGRFANLPDYIQLIFAIAPFALGAGYITGRPGLVVLAGGVLAYFIVTPVAFQAGWMPPDTAAADAPDIGHGAFNRPLGIGMLLGGAIMGVLFSLPAPLAALKSIASSARAGGRKKDELGLLVILVAGVVCIVGLFFASDYLRNWGDAPPDSKEGQATPDDDAAGEKADDDTSNTGLLGNLNPHVQSLIIAIIGGLWIWFAGIIIAQCTGMTDWSPISGMALLTVVLIMALGGTGDVMGAVLIGATLCVAVTCAADMMQDLKTGHLVGAQPRKQQIVELLATGLGPVIAMLTILIIAAANQEQHGVPMGKGTDTTAPQVQALQAVITGVQGGDMPYALYGAGAMLGVVLGLGSFAGLGVLVGLSMYLPIQYILTYGVGCLINMGVTRIKGKTWAEEWGVPFCAGLIVGEGILALVINFLVLILP